MSPEPKGELPCLSMSSGGRRVVVGTGMVLLLAITVAVFVMSDRDSHSASDTLRPFLITMVPLWILAVWGARTLINGKR